MGKSKKQSEIPEEPLGVNMERIKQMMGPLPNEHDISEKAVPKPAEIVEPVTAPEVPKASEAVNNAAKEANESLKAMSANLDNTPTEVTPMENTEPVGDGIVADDQATVSAINDIVSHEGDEVLAAEDESRGVTEEIEPASHGFKAWLKDLWAKPAARWSIIGASLALLVAVIVLPMSRYFILNTVGVRSSLSVAVVDSGTQLPLKNATVSLGNAIAQTDDSGKATLKHLKLGSASLHITKRAFRDVNQKITLGWGSNPLGQFSLSVSGVQYTFLVSDYLSGKPIEKAQATSGDGNALSDKNGKISLALDTSGKTDTDEISVKIVLGGYRDETVKITAATKTATKVKLVISHKDVFVSNRSGKYDIYSVDIDGKNEKKLVSGTGLERADLVLAPQQDSDVVAYIATRENVRNHDGYLLSTLYLLDESKGSLSKIDQSEQINLVGWSGDGRLVYVKIAAGTSSGNSKRVRLISVNSKNTSDSKELASANYFNDVVMAGDKILYAPSNALQDTKPGLFVVNSDGSNALTITNKEVYNIFRTDHDTVTIHTTEDYYTYAIGAASSTLTLTKTPKQTNTFYLDNQAGTKSLWTDSRDGKSLLLSLNKATKKDTTLVTTDGLKLPIVWLSDTVAVYRINDGKQTADYAVSTDGGQPQKITDLTDASGITRWYYY